MHIQTTVADNKGTLSLNGRFDFHSHKEFREASDALIGNAQVHEIIVNLAQVDYLDSSALGMLLLLREKASAAGKNVVLSSMSGTVKQVLEVANFSKLFSQQ